jgi:hypothetical protein
MKFGYFSKIYHLKSLCDRVVSGASVNPALKLRFSAMLILQFVGN